MLQLIIDKPKNLLKLSYFGHVNLEEAIQYVEQLPPLLAELKPGFFLLTDLGGVEVIDFECVPYIKKFMDLANARGVSTIVRVIHDPHKDIGLNIMSLFHYRRKTRIITCKTMQEALEALKLD
jgi:hypothetical protein